MLKVVRHFREKNNVRSSGSRVRAYTNSISISLSLLSVLGGFVHSIAHKHLPLHLPLAIEVLRDCFQSFGVSLGLKKLLELHL